VVQCDTIIGHSPVVVDSDTLIAKIVVVDSLNAQVLSGNFDLSVSRIDTVGYATTDVWDIITMWINTLVSDTGDVIRGEVRDSIGAYVSDSIDVQLQAHSDDLDVIAGLSPSADQIIVWNAGAPVGWVVGDIASISGYGAVVDTASLHDSLDVVRGEFVTGSATFSANAIVDTVVVSGITTNSAFQITAKTATPILLSATYHATDTMLVHCLETDTTVARTDGYFYSVRK
jgi:hypothetical protein